MPVHEVLTINSTRQDESLGEAVTTLEVALRDHGYLGREPSMSACVRTDEVMRGEVVDEEPSVDE